MSNSSSNISTTVDFNNSTVIRSATFSKNNRRNKTGTLSIMFENGKRTKYVSVPETRWSGLVNAERRSDRSAGGYYNRNIRSQYSHK